MNKQYKRARRFWASTFSLVFVLALLAAPVALGASVPNYSPNPNYPGNQQVGKAFAGFLGVLLIVAVVVFLVSLLGVVNAVRKGKDGNTRGPALGMVGSVILLFMIYGYAQFLNGAVSFIT